MHADSTVAVEVGSAELDTPLESVVAKLSGVSDDDASLQIAEASSSSAPVKKAIEDDEEEGFWKVEDDIAKTGEGTQIIDDDLEGEAGVRYLAEQWVWEDGVPVNGSTPDRVSRALADLEVDVFVDDAPEDLSEYGLNPPIARAVLTDRDENERVVLIGGEGEPLLDPEGRERPRRYALIEGDSSVYLIDEHPLKTVKDMVRERNRKAEKDAARAANREQIPSEALPEDDEEGEDL